MDNKSLIEAVYDNYSAVIIRLHPHDYGNSIHFHDVGQRDWTSYIRSVPKDINFPRFLDKIFEAGVEKGKLDKVAEIRQSLGIV
jgi:hypothetical protein